MLWAHFTARRKSCALFSHANLGGPGSAASDVRMRCGRGSAMRDFCRHCCAPQLVYSQPIPLHKHACGVTALPESWRAGDE